MGLFNLEKHVCQPTHKESTRFHPSVLLRYTQCSGLYPFVFLVHDAALSNSHGSCSTMCVLDFVSNSMLAAMRIGATTSHEVVSGPTYARKDYVKFPY